jgi:SWIM zinc finger
MTEAQFEVRQERADNGTLIVSKTEEGFRVYSVHTPSKMYLVKKEGERWTCTCPDFESHKLDTTWRCKHILAVAPWQNQERVQAAQSDNGKPNKPAFPAETPAELRTPKMRTRKSSNGSAQMLIKRSVSPDGRIDSVSVEFSMPVSDISNGEIKQRALSTLELQKEIVGAFLIRFSSGSLPCARAGEAQWAEGIAGAHPALRTKQAWEWRRKACFRPDDRHRQGQRQVGRAVLHQLCRGWPPLAFVRLSQTTCGAHCRRRLRDRCGKYRGGPAAEPRVQGRYEAQRRWEIFERREGPSD